ncbi:hypothetical protein BH20ACT24_BH20ACT24_14260 [soil metagenome]
MRRTSRPAGAATLEFVLIHSPLVGPATWALVAQALAHRGADVVVPDLRSADQGLDDPPHWPRHARAVASAVEAALGKGPLVLVAHSGAGPLLPAVRLALGNPVAAYLFVDAGLPRGGLSRLELFEDSEAVRMFRASAKGGLLPPWTSEDLREAIPNERVRDRFVAELRPLALSVYEEPLPVFEGWPDAPCGYIRFGANPAYDSPATQAEGAGWPVVRLPGEHFHMLVDPRGVADALVGLAELVLRADARPGGGEPVS